MTKKKIEEWQTLIRTGRGQKVAKEINKINFSKIPRDLRVEVANCCHRLNLNNKGVLALRPIIRPKTDLKIPATAHERSEYGLLLLRLGAYEEAQRLLENIDEEENHSALLYLGFISMSQWEYSNASRFLRKYIRRESAKNYMALVAKVNLAAALVNLQKYEEAVKLLVPLVDRLLKKNHHLLAGNCYELLAQNWIGLGDYKRAEESLDLSGKFLKGSQIGSLFVDKWRTVLSLRTKKTSKGALNIIREKAFILDHWETLRDCDYHEWVFEKNEELAQKLFFGTPFKSFRQRVQSESLIEFPEKYIWKSGNKSLEKVIQLKTGRISDNKDYTEYYFKSAQQPHHLLMILSADFYRGLSIGTLFSKLFTGEFYNPSSSPDRVHKVLNRLTKFIDQKNLPLKLQLKNGNYRLALGEGLGIELEKSQRSYTRSEVITARLADEFEKNYFKVDQYSECIQVSKSMAYKELSQLLSEKRLVKEARGKDVRYKLAKKSNKQ